MKFQLSPILIIVLAFGLMALIIGLLILGSPDLAQAVIDILSDLLGGGE